MAKSPSAKKSSARSPSTKTEMSDAQREFLETGATRKGSKERREVKKQQEHSQSRHSQPKPSEPKKKEGIRRLLEIARTRRGHLIVACIFAVISSAARLIPFITIYLLICELVLKFNDLATIDTVYVWTLVAITFIAAVVFGICSYLSSVFAHISAFNILYEIRIQLMEKLNRIPSGFLARNRQGAIKKVINDDVESIEEFIAHHLADTVSAIALPLLTLVYLFSMDWRLALLTLIPLVVAMVLLNVGLGAPEGAASQKAMRDSRERMNGTIVEYVHGMPVVKIFNRTLSAFARFEHDVGEYVKNLKWTTHFFAPWMGVLYTALGVQILFLLPAAIILAPTADSYTDFLPLVLLFFLVGAGLKEPYQEMMTMMTDMGRINVSVERIDQILAEEEIEYAEGDKTPDRFDITFKDVVFSYDAKAAPALKGVSFTLEEGSINGLVGPSGGGKSTIAQLILRFYEPDSGTICIGGVDIRQMSSKTLTGLVSYVSQDSFLFNDTIENNIRMGDMSATKEAVIQAAQAANINDVIESLPSTYETIIGQDDAYLSGGEKQRIAIARIFLKDTPIVLLDEATAYADADNESKIQESFARLAAHKTVLIIAHRLKSIENASHIFLMKDGELVDSGTHGDLLRRNRVYNDMVAANERRDRWTIRKRKGVDDACA